MRMEMEEVSCCHCGRFFIPDGRQKNPTRCKRAICQRARKALWQREKMRLDPVYKADQRRCGDEWRKSHPGYWKEYRDSHPEQASRNRDLQLLRNRKRRKRTAVVQAVQGMGMIAKMDSLKSPVSSGRGLFSGQFWLVLVIAKMDASKVNMYVITGC
jgi:hypothetical protein